MTQKNKTENDPQDMDFWLCDCGDIKEADEVCSECGQDQNSGNDLPPVKVLWRVGKTLGRPASCMIPTPRAIDGEYVAKEEASGAQSVSDFIGRIAEACRKANDDIQNTTILPDNPTNVKNLDDIAKLRHYGFEGPDADLSTSLHEYGMVWRRVGPDSVLFIYPRPRKRRGMARPEHQTRYYRCTMSDMTFDSDFDWIDEEWDSIIPGDQTREEWKASRPLEQRIYDIHQYFGPLEVVGEVNWEGFLIEDPDDPKYLKFLRATVDVSLAGVADRREKVDSDTEIARRIRRRIRERVNATGVSSENGVYMPEIVYRNETVNLSLELNPEYIDSRWPDLYARQKKAMVAEDVAHEVDMVLKELGIGHVNGVCPDMEYQHKMDMMETDAFTRNI